MEITVHTHQGYTTLVPTGEIDANSSMELDGRLDELIQNGQVQLHIDLSQVHYISSAGLGVFISKLEELKARNGKLVLSRLRDNVKDVFDLLGLNQLVTIIPADSEVAKHFEEV